jgi:HAD superfamily hydrolase (TIGR01509 family)
MQTKAVFLDAAGVLLDTAAMPPQWQRAIAMQLVPKLGGTPEAWAAANVYARERWTTRIEEAQRKAGPRKGSRDAHVSARTQWLADMCEHAGVRVPADVEAMAEDTHRACASQVRAPLGDAVAAVQALRDAGYTLFTATGQPSWEIGAYLHAMGIRDIFDRTYGCDLVDRWKSGPHYYRAISEDADIDPRRAVCVDDTPVVLDWAKKAGMRTFLLGGQGGGQRHERIASLMELEPLI